MKVLSCLLHQVIVLPQVKSKKDYIRWLFVCGCEAVKAMKYADTNKYGYIAFGVGFDAC